jgi:hypothetical protein
MESINVCFSAFGVEDVAPHDGKSRHYCLGLVDHSELSPLHVLTSFFLKNEMKLVTIGGTKVVHDVGSI